VVIVYEIYRPAADRIRAAGDDDPTGGVLDGGEDLPLLVWGGREVRLGGRTLRVGVRRTTAVERTSRRPDENRAEPGAEPVEVSGPPAAGPA